MSENVKFEEQKSKIIKVLTTMFDYLGLSASLRVEEKGTRIGVKISSDDAGRIIGRKGQTLESLQLLLNRIMFKDDEECPHIMLDIDGYARGERGARSEGAEADEDANGEGEERRERPQRERRDDRRNVPSVRLRQGENAPSGRGLRPREIRGYQSRRFRSRV